jgi:hypothetical protein
VALAGFVFEVELRVLMAVDPNHAGRNFGGAAHGDEQGRDAVAIGLAVFEGLDGRLVLGAFFVLHVVDDVVVH